ncbi:hypothetical protein AbraIFM66951_008004, partial [Aspergillus brasiliensis]
MYVLGGKLNAHFVMPRFLQIQTPGIDCPVTAKDDEALNSTGPDSAADTTVTTVSTPTPVTPQSEHLTLSKPITLNTQTGKIENLQYSDNYIGVGVLRKRNASYGDAAVPIEPDDFPAMEIAALEKNSWIWTETITFGEDPLWCGVRVYMLPDDVGRKSIPRSSTALRRALKTVMLRIDRSVEAWNGILHVDLKA